MKKVSLIIMFMFLVHGFASAGTLYGRIIKSDGSSLADSMIIFCRDSVIIDTTTNTTNNEMTITKTDSVVVIDTITTNVVGGYSVNIPDGRHKIKLYLGDQVYQSDTLEIFSPRTKQDWQLGRIGKKDGIGILIRIQ